MKRLLVSACLLGQPVRYDGESNANKVNQLAEQLRQWQQQGRIIAVCPEVAGGLTTPRPAAEIQGGDGHDVLDGKAKVITTQGDDVTTEFIKGAQQTLALAQKYHAMAALLAARSPSCGVGQIYDGEFQRQLTQGDGVTVALLQRHGIQCFSPDDHSCLLHWMNDL